MQMRTFTFSVVLDGFQEPTCEIEDALYEAGCDDGMLFFRGRTPAVEFDRQAASIGDAIASAILDITRASTGASIRRVLIGHS